MDLYTKFNNVIKASNAKLYARDPTKSLKSDRMGGGGGDGVVYRPPLKSFIRNVLPKKKITFMAPKDRENREKKLPVNWTWRNKPGISEPFDQKMCGSCWAVSAAQLFSDVIAIKMKLSKSPLVSETHILMCHGQYQCSGGIPGKALDDLIERGASTQNCIDYSWCLDNEKCNGSSLEHFDAGEYNLNDLIPKCLGCKQPAMDIMDEKVIIDSERELTECNSLQLSYLSKSLTCNKASTGSYRYYAKNAFAVFAENDEQIQDARYDVKEHILEVGPCMGAFFILSNFLDAIKFEQTGGIYMENFPYRTLEGQKQPELNGDPSFDIKYKVEGGHAVIVMGWGVQVIDTINPDTGEAYGSIDYWVVKNTWGRDWGDDGYFKIAMYPHNKFSQFDKGLDAGVDRSGNRIWMGGMYLVEYDRRVYQPIERVLDSDGNVKEIERDVVFSKKYTKLNLEIKVFRYIEDNRLEIIVSRSGDKVEEYNFLFIESMDGSLTIAEEVGVTDVDNVVITTDGSNVQVVIGDINFTYKNQKVPTIVGLSDTTDTKDGGWVWVLVWVLVAVGVVAVGVAVAVWVRTKNNRKTPENGILTAYF